MVSPVVKYPAEEKKVSPMIGTTAMPISTLGKMTDTKRPYAVPYHIQLVRITTRGM